MPPLRPAPRTLRRTPPRAFTLIELLTVIAIIGILAAILIPVVGRVRETARSANCMSNLKGIGSAFQLYAADNQGLYPALRFKNANKGVSGTNPSEENWQIEISPYHSRKLTNIVQSKADTDAYVFCPEFVSRYRNDPKWTSSTTSAGYGMNPNIGVSGVWDYRFRANLISHPARTVLVGESGDHFLNIASKWTPNDTAMTGYSGGDPERHRSGSNYLFADGHVAALSPEAGLDALVNRPAN